MDNNVRFNKEYFGYIAAYPNGDIVLTKESAGPLLEKNAPLKSLKEHLLTELEVKPNFFLNTPPLVWFEITRRCNLTCPHCYIEGGKARRNEMSDDEIHKLIDEMADIGVWAIAFTGGEPTLHPSFVDFVIHARERGILVGIASHGLNLTDNLLDMMPKKGVVISVSLDELHIRGKNPESDFNAATNAILRARNHGFNANIMTNTNKKNINHLERMMNWAKTHGVSVRSVPFAPIGARAKTNQYLENTPEDVDKISKFWIEEINWEHEYHEKVGLCVGRIFNYGNTLSFITRRCSSARFLAYIASDGTLFPCTMCAGEEIFHAGKVQEDGFTKLWRANWEIRKYSWDNFKKTCMNCLLNDPKYYCTYRCPALSHARNDGELFGCGASDFAKKSLFVRTDILQSTYLDKDPFEISSPNTVLM